MLGTLDFNSPWPIPKGKVQQRSCSKFEATPRVLPKGSRVAWVLLGNIFPIFAYGGLVVEIQPLNC